MSLATRAPKKWYIHPFDQRGRVTLRRQGVTCLAIHGVSKEWESVASLDGAAATTTSHSQRSRIQGFRHRIAMPDTTGSKCLLYRQSEAVTNRTVQLRGKS